MFSKLLHVNSSKSDSSSNGDKQSPNRKKQYTFEDTLGQGAFGVVKRAHLKGQAAGVDVAIKKVKKKAVATTKEQLKVRTAAISNLKAFDHPHIVNLIEWFESKNHYFIVYEYYPGHELFDRIIENGKMSEPDSRIATIALLDAIRYLHERNVVHRDIKPENILMKSDHGPADDLVLADFGLATQAPKPPEKLYAVCGSPGYAAPEVYQRTGYSKPADLWSTGVVIYAMLSGRSPFRSSETPELIEECRQGKVSYPSRYWESVSKEALDFVKSLLEIDQDKRLTAAQALEHPWIKNPPDCASPDKTVSVDAPSRTGSSSTVSSAGAPVERRPTLREAEQRLSGKSSDGALPDDAYASSNAGGGQLRSCTSWRFMPNGQKDTKGVKDVPVPDLQDSDEMPPSLASLDSSDTDSPVSSQPGTRRGSVADDLTDGVDNVRIVNGDSKDSGDQKETIKSRAVPGHF